MNDEMRIGFIGFGEAGFHIARGCVARAYPASAPTTSTRARRDWARRFGGGPARPKSRLESNAELAAASDVLLDCDREPQPGGCGTDCPFLSSRHIYADLNSVSPALKQTIGRMVESRGARFVEAAVMSPAPRHGAAVPMFLCGAYAREFADLLLAYGMNLEVISERIGAASAVKMCRSVVVKDSKR